MVTAARVERQEMAASAVTVARVVPAVLPVMAARVEQAEMPTEVMAATVAQG